jgi:Ca2+-transporting ATPase
MLIAAHKVGWTRDQLEKDMPRVNELPFSSERKAMTTVHQVISDKGRELFESGHISITKGAPDRLIDWATQEHIADGPRDLSEERRQRWQQKVDEMAAEGLRVLGVAYRPLETTPETMTPEMERELVLLGLVGIVDPARPEAKEAVTVARNAGIRSIMITGDHALTAESIARNLGIIDETQRAVSGSQLSGMTDDELRETLKQTSAFARVSPEHKLRIVRVLQNQGEVTAMTGDGVNDAPALKQADIGVAMGITGTDVSKGAAEMVLTDDNFASIVAAVEEGRTIFDNIRKFLKYLLSSNVGEILVMFTALMVGMKIPLLAIQILWINLVTDGLPAIAVGFSRTEEGVMKRKPRPVDESVFAGGTGRHIVWVGILIAALTLGGFIYGFDAHDMKPFSATLGLEEFTEAELIELVGEDEVNDALSPEDLAVFAEEGEAPPTSWGDLTRDQRIELLEGDVEGFEEESSGGILGYAERIPRTIAFTILAFTQMFEVMGIHGGDRASFFRIGFNRNWLLMWAVLSTFLLQMAVIYIPFLQTAFDTAPLSAYELFLSFLLGAVVLFGVELEKYYTRMTDPKTTS